MNDNYEEIINLPHHVSKKHTPMSMWNRAAQFAPFAALNGHNSALMETEKHIKKIHHSLYPPNMRMGRIIYSTRTVFTMLML